MEYSRIIHLEKPNTLSERLMECWFITSLKVTGVIGKTDFTEKLDFLCYTDGTYDDDDNFIPDWENSSALRHLDLGEAIYLDGETLPYFGFYAPLKTLILPQGITSIDTETGFSNSEMLTTLVLPQGLKEISGFRCCPNLTDVILPESLESIWGSAFAHCESITSIRIPSKVKYLDGGCFSGCAIKAFEVAEDNPYFTTIDGVIYNKDITELVAFPPAYPNTHFTVPQSVKTIGYAAFKWSPIEQITLPYGLTTIKRDAFACSDIRKISLPDTVTKIEESVFEFCYDLEYAQLSNRLKKLPQNLFWCCYGLKELHLPTSIKTIEYEAFSWCYDLEELSLPNKPNDPTIRKYLIKNAQQLCTLPYTKALNIKPWGLIGYNTKLKAYHVAPDYPFRVINGALCSKDGRILYKAPHRKNYIIPEGIEVIATNAFAHLTKLHKIVLPSTLKSIEFLAFNFNEALEELTIPASLKRMHLKALGNHNLRTIIMEGKRPPKMIEINMPRMYGDLKGVKLLVPPTAVRAYKRAPGWQQASVEEIPQRG